MAKVITTCREMCLEVLCDPLELTKVLHILCIGGPEGDVHGSYVETHKEIICESRGDPLGNVQTSHWTIWDLEEIQCYPKGPQCCFSSDWWVSII
jgi:hypothetical protein